MQKRFPKCFKNFLRISLKVFLKYITYNFEKFRFKVPQILFRIFVNFTKIYPKFSKYFYNNSSNFSKIFSKFYSNLKVFILGKTRLDFTYTFPNNFSNG